VSRGKKNCGCGDVALIAQASAAIVNGTVRNTAPRDTRPRWSMEAHDGG
jgi:hypothetical protein